MPFKRPNARVLERTTTSGNGPYTLAGAVDGSFNTFASYLANGDTTYASVVEPGVAFWTGIVTFNTGPNRITLTTVEESKGTFGAGTKEIFASALASTATVREDLAGAIVTGGTSTAYTVASFRKFDTLTRLHGNAIAFTPHVTNGATVTLNVDGLGAKPLRLAPGVELQSNTLIAGTPYTALYNHSDQVFYLHILGSNAYGIPLAGGLDFWGLTTPSSAFAFPAGQAISRSTYAALFALIGTTYGAGDGSTTFNLPDKTGRVSAMKEAVASRLTATYFGGNSANLGAVGGVEQRTLELGHLPANITARNASQNIQVSYTVAASKQFTISAAVGNWTPAVGNGGSINTPTGTGGFSGLSTIDPSGNNDINVTANNTGSNAAGGAKNLPTVQPTIVCNYIMRVL
jgi:microcystin-dependent protein